MIQKLAGKACSKKSYICLLLVVFFCVFTITLHINDVTGRGLVLVSATASNQMDTTKAGNMANSMDNNDLLFGSVMINEMRTGNGHYIMQAVHWSKSAAPILRFVLNWFVLILAVSLIIGYWYLTSVHKKFKIKFYLYILLHFIHNCDGKKPLCFA